MSFPLTVCLDCMLRTHESGFMKGLARFYLVAPSHHFGALVSLTSPVRRRGIGKGESTFDAIVDTIL